MTTPDGLADADLGPAPEVAISGTVNFRDVGGLRAGSGRTRSRVLYRSGNLAHLDAGGLTALGELGIHRVVDLRADDEVLSAPSRVEGLGLTIQRVPLFLGSVASFFADDISLDEMYRGWSKTRRRAWWRWCARSSPRSRCSCTARSGRIAPG